LFHVGHWQHEQAEHQNRSDCRHYIAAVGQASS
jgi:hypothetical protein